MGAHPVLRRFTPDEHLRLERRADSKSEYVDGQIFAMASGTVDHARIIMKLTALLLQALAGRPCGVWSSDPRIAVSKRRPYFYPDLSVICGEPQLLDRSRDCALNPTVVFEVLSKSRRKYDREVKAAGYLEIPTLRHIVLVSQQTIAIEHHFRVADAEWKAEKLEDRQADLKLTAIQAILPLTNVYEGLSLQSRA